MKSRWMSAVCCAISLFCVGSLHAQGVYVTQGPNGPVFSNKPQPGAKEVTLPPLSVVPAVKDTRPASPPATPANPATPARSSGDAPVIANVPGATTRTPEVQYQSLKIIFPEDAGVVGGSAGGLPVRVQADPPLSVGDGHFFEVSLNGQPIREVFALPDFSVGPELLNTLSLPPNQQVKMAVNIINKRGQVLKRSAPIEFVLKRSVFEPPEASSIVTPSSAAPPINAPRAAPPAQ